MIHDIFGISRCATQGAGVGIDVEHYQTLGSTVVVDVESTGILVRHVDASTVEVLGGGLPGSCLPDESGGLLNEAHDRATVAAVLTPDNLRILAALGIDGERRGIQVRVVLGEVFGSL